jgi:hypothetical protein
MPGMEPFKPSALTRLTRYLTRIPEPWRLTRPNPTQPSHLFPHRRCAAPLPTFVAFALHRLMLARAATHLPRPLPPKPDPTLDSNPM